MTQFPRKEPMDFLVVGGQRCGTGWLAECLREHPQISMAKDESRYFTENYSRGPDWWIQNYLPSSGDSITSTGEKCANYISSHEALERISNLPTSIKAIVCVRNPVDRYRSARLMKNRIADGGVEIDVIDNEDFERGLFGKYCQKYISALGSENVLVVFYDDMIKNPREFLKNIFEFLNVNSEFLPKSTERQTKPGALENKHPLVARIAFILLHRKSPFKKVYSKLRGVVSTKRVMTEFDQQLMQRYLPDIELLEKVTGRKLDLWKFGK